jgi:isoquinoline 1-oxidoreductase beta subunit
MRGFIKVVPIEGGLAVVADNWWRAKEMALKLPVVWDEGAGPLATNASIDGLLRAALDRPTPAVARDKGRTADAFASAVTAGKVLEAEYFTPFLAHATLEPQVCTALLKNGKLEVWASTQNAESSLGHAATAAGVPPESVEIHRMQCGGGFGRRAASQDFIRQGVTIAKAMEGTPVKMLWTREEDTQHDFYRPVAMYRMRASLDAQRKPEAWSTRIAMPSLFATLLRLPLKDGLDPMAIEGFADFPYEFPNQRMEYARCDTPVPVGFWRGVGHSQNPFARECFMDEVAHAAGQDSLEFRRTLLAREPRTLGVLEAVAKAANWGGALPAGVFRGIAVSEPYGSYAAAVIEVSVDAKGVLLIRRVVVAIDCGYMVNPDTVVAQTQGCVVFGLTAALSGDITIKDGRVAQSNFHDYPLMRMAEIPPVEVVLAPSGGFWGGVGEPGLAPIAPALCNAIFEATGKRIRALPINQHDLRKA